MKLLLSYLAISILAVTQLTGCDFSLTYDPSKLRPNIPLYPNAQHVTTQENPVSQTNSQYTRLTTFDTSDKPEVVLDFYSDYLSKDGWTENEPATPVPTKMYFIKVLGGTKPTYGLAVSADANGRGPTHVELNLGEYLPH